MKLVSMLIAVWLGALSPACNGPIDTLGAGGTGGSGGSAGMGCPLPPSASIPPACLSCIKASCPSVYADLCSADCAANEYGPACLSAQREVGTCLADTHCIACGMTHGSVYVGGAPGIGDDPTIGGAGGSETLSQAGASSLAGAAGSDP